MNQTFISSSPALKVYAGPDALSMLGTELARQNVKRALLLCGQTLSRHTALMDQLARQAEGRIADIHGAIGKDAPLSDLQSAVDVARHIRADGLIALGSGSVIKATRVIAILLAEPGPLETLVTRYPASGPAISARLQAPKLPIINIPTAPTSAQARAGSAVAGDSGRLEFYDPKTRPKALFWAPEALATAPPALARDTAFTVYWRALMNIAIVEVANPLVRASRREAWNIAQDVVKQATLTPGQRQDLCAAALLQNRDEDDGGRPMDSHWVARIVYALAAGTFHVCPRITQADAHAAFTPAAIKLAPASEAATLSAMAAAVHTDPTPAYLAEHLRQLWQRPSLTELGVNANHWPDILALTRRNFNADRKREFDGQERALRNVFETALAMT